MKLQDEPVRILSRQNILACPHVIIVASHYYIDGTCRCNDPTHKEMMDWGYKWSNKKNRWT